MKKETFVLGKPHPRLDGPAKVTGQAMSLAAGSCA